MMDRFEFVRLAGILSLWSVFAIVGRQSASDNTGGRVERRDVEVLHTTAERVFVRGAIDEGDQIVGSGIHRLVPGQAVRVIAGDEQLVLQEQG